MPTNACCPSLNDFCTKYFVIGPKPLAAEDVQMLPERAVLEFASNIPLAFLYRQLGENGLEGPSRFATLQVYQRPMLSLEAIKKMSLQALLCA